MITDGKLLKTIFKNLGYYVISVDKWNNDAYRVIVLANIYTCLKNVRVRSVYLLPNGKQNNIQLIIRKCDLANFYDEYCQSN